MTGAGVVYGCTAVDGCCTAMAGGTVKKTKTNTVKSIKTEQYKTHCNEYLDRWLF